MNVNIVETVTPVTLLGGGALPPGLLGEVLALAPVLVAADGAAKTALAAGHLPEAVIGDLDSLDPASRAVIPPDRIHEIAEQDSTDFDKALRSIAAPMVLAVGFTGARLDHELAVYNALVRHAARRCVVIGTEDICFVAPPRLALDLPEACRVSLFPLAPVRVTATGLRWPLAAAALAPEARIGTSNAALGGVVILEVSRPGLLVILPRRALGPALAALSPASGG